MEFARGALVRRFVEELRDVGLAVLDPRGDLLTWNEGARAMLGYSASEVIGRHLTSIHADEEVALSALVLARAHGRHEAVARLRHRDGGDLSVRSVVVRIAGATDDDSGFGLLLGGGAAIAPPVGTAATERERILVVDDDTAVREVTARRLASLGYRVIAAAGSGEALAVLSKGTPVDLLLTDVVMPGDMSGAELAREARRLRPQIGLLFASGYLEDALIRNETLEAGVNFLIKPCSKAELAEKVREALDAAALRGAGR